MRSIPTKHRLQNLSGKECGRYEKTNVNIKVGDKITIGKKRMEHCRTDCLCELFHAPRKKHRSDNNIATLITERDITKMCDQLDHSRGSYMQYFQVLCILLSAVLIYLLTKIIIEKNENAISMTKILGYISPPPATRRFLPSPPTACRFLPNRKMMT